MRMRQVRKAKPQGLSWLQHSRESLAELGALVADAHVAGAQP